VALLLLLSVSFTIWGLVLRMDQSTVPLHHPYTNSNDTNELEFACSGLQTLTTIASTINILGIICSSAMLIFIKRRPMVISEMFCIYLACSIIYFVTSMDILTTQYVWDKCIHHSKFIFIIVEMGHQILIMVSSLILYIYYVCNRHTDISNNVNQVAQSLPSISTLPIIPTIVVPIHDENVKSKS